MPRGERFSHYYVPESVGIATLPHSPSPKGFLSKLCGRRGAEKPIMLLVVGYPKVGCQVPVHGGIKKPLEAISTSP